MSYHVQVYHAEEDDVNQVFDTCTLMKDQERYEGNYMEEVEVIFRLRSISVLPPCLVLSLGTQGYKSVESCEAPSIREQQNVFQTVDVSSTRKVDTFRAEINCTTSKMCPKKEKQRSPPPPIVSIRVKPEPPPVFIKETIVTKPKMPLEQPKMKITFSTCTVMYKPAQPVYEDYKRRKSLGSSAGLGRDKMYRRLSNF